MQKRQTKFRFRQKWHQIKGLDEYFQEMVVKNFLGQVNTCFCHNKVEILPIFISLYFVNEQPLPQNLIDRMRVIDAHYKTVFKLPF